MASTSSPTTPCWKHDVFLSFRGTDTRNSFTSHLYHALQRNQIDAYIDNQLDGGEKIEPALLEKIEDSYISVVIFSENYADSTFCLRELSKIHECMETKGQIVLPVFHQLDPSQVQNLTGSYGEALARHERDCASEEVESWRHASKEIANLKGWDSSVMKDENRLIKEIVSDIQKKLHHAPSPSIDAERLVGMQSRVKHIESLLSFGSTGVLIVGIWGMGGIGKTTTAEAIYNQNFHKFEGHYFFRNVREESHKHGVGHVRQEILGEVIKKKDLNIHTTELPPDIKRMLQRKKVLIVLDDVNDTQHLKFLVGEDDLFGHGSRILVTSRDRQVLINACQENRIHKVNDLDEDDALRLFSFHAFKQNNPPDGYRRLSKTVVSRVKGIPLVLEVLGASLYKKTSVEYWESKVAQLRTNGGEDIKKCLEMCYDELDRTEKKIFLDIACFFGRCTRDYLQQTLDLEERSGIDRLIDMCLIKIVENEIWMHDVLLKLGRDIVFQENVDPRERSRLWDAKDVYRVLTTQGTGKVESISLNLSETTEINLSPAAFEGMYNLRLLQFYNPPFLMESVRINLPQGLHFLSNELRILYWCNFPLKSLPSNFCPEKLVVLEMPWSQLEQIWNDYQPLKNLKLMNLHASSKLILIDSDFSKVPNLEVLNLGQCRYCMGRGLISKCSEHCTKSYDYKSLCTLPSSIGFLLSQLVILNLSCRGGLTFLPDSIGELKSLAELNLQNCSELASLPESIGELTCLVRLNLSYCSKLACLPESIGELKSLVELNLDSCSELASLPDSIGKLKYLVKLNLEYVSELSSLPDSIGELKCLAKLNLSDCLILASLPDSIGELKYLAKLNLSGCSKLKSLPDSIGKLKCLVKLDLSSCSKLSSLPYSIGELKYLAKLNLSSCSKLKSLPDSIGKLKCLVELYLSCTEIPSLPDSIGELKCLAKLILCCCSKLKSLPSSIYGLESLQWLDLGNCYKMNGFPILNLRRSEVEEIASTTNRLDCPQFLNLGASGVSEIPGSIGSLVSLRDLRLSCDDFERIPANIMQLPMLIELNLHGCRSLQHLPQLPSSLQVLIASDCISLTSVEGIFMQGEEDYEAASQEFDFCNCLQLDQNSFTKIIGDARLRILRMTTSLFNQQYFGEPIRVRLCIPGSEVPEWFTYKNTGGPSVKIKLPAHWHRANTTDQLFGFTLCAVVSFVSCQKYYDFDIKCECHLITEDGTQSDLGFHYYKIDEVNGWSTWKREHVFIWSIHSHIFFKEASFHFKLLGEITADAVVQSGVHPLFVQDYTDEPEQPHTEIDGKCLTTSSI